MVSSSTMEKDELKSPASNTPSVEAREDADSVSTKESGDGQYKRTLSARQVHVGAFNPPPPNSQEKSGKVSLANVWR